MIEIFCHGADMTTDTSTTFCSTRAIQHPSCGISRLPPVFTTILLIFHPLCATFLAHHVSLFSSILLSQDQHGPPSSTSSFGHTRHQFTIVRNYSPSVTPTALVAVVVQWCLHCCPCGFTAVLALLVAVLEFVSLN